MDTVSRLEDHFRTEGYKKLYMEGQGLSVWFLREQDFVTCVALCSMDGTDPQTDSDYRSRTEKIEWRFRDARIDQLHLLTILIGADAQRLLALCEGDHFCWVADSASGTLWIGPGHAENFYGLRDGIREALANPGSVHRYLEEPLEYEPGGKLCYRHIGQRPVANHGLMLANLFGYVLCILFVRAIYDWGDLRYDLVLQNGQWYRIFTSMFLHADPGHLTGNMLMLLLIGDMAERALGHLKYLIIYLTGGILAAFCSMGFAYFRADLTGSIGASGAVFAAVGALLWIILRNGGKLETLTTKKILFLIAYTLYFGFTSTGVDNAAHVGGLAGGFLLGILFYRKKRRKE